MSDERRDYAILVQLYMREEAEVMASALRAEGIDAFIGNSQHAYFNWHYVIALGGLQVMVPRNRIDEAKAALRVRWQEAAENPEGEPVKRRDRWKLWLVIGGYVSLTVFYYWANHAYQEQLQRWQDEYWAAQAGRREPILSFSEPPLASDPTLKDYCFDFPYDSVEARVDGEIRNVPCAEILQQLE